jgi:pyrimidine-nucleoside phosphorylase
MRAAEIIAKKRDGGELSAEEIAFLAEGYRAGRVPPEQASAFLMALSFAGANERETSDLSRSLVDSGRSFAPAELPDPSVGFFSTGGVGDKTPLVLAPLLAACGVHVPITDARSPRGGAGPAEKLSAVRGFSGELPVARFLRLLSRCGCVVARPAMRYVPLEEALSNLARETGAGGSPAFLSGGILARAFAAGLRRFVVDVKYGAGAATRDRGRAEALADTVVAAGRRLGCAVVALVTSLDQPLGRSVGSALELKEVLAVLSDEGPEDVRRLVLAAGSWMVLLAGKARVAEEAQYVLMNALRDGRALVKFHEMVRAQGGDAACLVDTRRLPAARRRVEILPGEVGYVAAVDAGAIETAVRLLARPPRDGARTDHAAGIELCKKVGERVRAKEPLAVLHAGRGGDPAAAAAVARGAFRVEKTVSLPERLVYKVRR